MRCLYALLVLASATLLCHERLRGGEVPGSDETAAALVRFWGGEPLRIPDLRRTLKSVGAAGLFSFTPVIARELARQRFRFQSAVTSQSEFEMISFLPPDFPASNSETAIGRHSKAWGGALQTV